MIINHCVHEDVQPHYAQTYYVVAFHIFSDSFLDKAIKSPEQRKKYNQLMNAAT